MNKAKSPLTKRILIFGIISGVISLALATIGFGIVEFYDIRNESRNKLSSQMDILAYNLKPTILFSDADAAKEILMSLRDDPTIKRAVLLNLNGTEFTSFSFKDTPADIRKVRNLVHNNQNIGRLVLESTYPGMQERYLTYFLISLIIIIITIPALYFISGPIRTQIYAAVSKIEKQSSRLRLLADQLVATEQRERKRIAALIHDHLQQILVASKLQIGQSLKAMNAQDYHKVAASLEKGNKFLEDAIHTAKSLTAELRPPVLYEDGLTAAFQWLVKKFQDEHGLNIYFQAGNEPRNLPDSLKIMLYESVKELLFNVTKHAGVNKAELSLTYGRESIIALVKDAGRGFNAAQLEKTASSSGFGLFSIQERLKLLNGHLSIQSFPEYGSSVKIVLPMDMIEEVPPELAAPVNYPRDIEKAKDKERLIRILLVDDHQLVREGIYNILKENSIFKIVAQAQNGIEAVDKTETYRPDVVIMDVNMPQRNGIEATRIIKSRFPAIDVIGLSVLDEKDTAESIKKAGAVTLLNKGGDPQELIKTILACVEQ